MRMFWGLIIAPWDWNWICNTRTAQAVLVLRLIFKFQFDGEFALHPKAPLCKGGCQKSLILDWGIVAVRQPLRSKSKILTTSPYTGEARASRSILPDKHQFIFLLQAL